MDKNIYEILNKIEKCGFEAYIVGGYVRDYLLGIKSYDIDICTNALPKDIAKIFIGNVSNINYGSYKLTFNNYNFDITTYRRELEYTNRRPTKIEYTSNLLLDIERRDFTMNTIIMNKKGEIIDLLGGINDIQNKKIKCVGNPDNKLKEDPLRILRAIRFAITLNFSLDKELLSAIKRNKKLINTLSYQRKRSELDKILASKYVIKGINLLKKLDLLSMLEINVKKLVLVDDLAGMYAQIEVSDNYPFTKTEKNNIEKIKKIVKYGKIDNYILFNEGLYLSSVAGIILGKTRIQIAKKYETLPIKSRKDLEITTNEIESILSINKNQLKDIIDTLINLILNNKLKNTNEDLVKYLQNNKWRYHNE